jgi:D-3-phosphoglycerate dehydrogenase
MKVHANDGIAKSGITVLEKEGFEVITSKVPQEKLIEYINKDQINALLVRSATKVRKEMIDACPSLKIIGRGGVGMDNIDVEYARSKGIKVINTPAASSHSVAELVFAHLFGMARFLNQSNREMPLEGDTKFQSLKKAFAQGVELRGKQLGIIGFGRIGQATAKIAIGLGMKVAAYDPFIEKMDLELTFFNDQKVSFTIQTQTKEEVLKSSDFVSIHVPAQDTYVISTNELKMMKEEAMLVNAARGGVVDEVALLKAIESGKIASAAFDVFENEPIPDVKLLMNSQLSLSPHIGAATVEAQERIGVELANQIIELARAE